MYDVYKTCLVHDKNLKKAVCINQHNGKSVSRKLTRCSNETCVLGARAAFDTLRVPRTGKTFDRCKFDELTLLQTVFSLRFLLGCNIETMLSCFRFSALFICHCYIYCCYVYD